MKPIQKGRVGQVLAEEFGLKGRTSPQIDEVVVPTTTLIDIPNTPNRIPNSVIGVTSKLAVVGEFSFVGIDCAPGKLLICRGIIIRNIAGGNIGLNIRLDDPALSLVRVTTQASYVSGRAVTSPHTIFNTSNALAIGTLIASVSTLTSTSLHWKPSIPIVLSGPQGRVWPSPATVPSGIMVVPTANNTAVQASFECDEYDLPG